MLFYHTQKIRSLSIVFLPIFMLFSYTVSHSVESRKPVKELIAQVEKVYAGTSTLKAHFDQLSTNSMSQKKSSGTVYLKKPGKMRWEYEKPRKKLFVADGTTLWQDEPDDDDRVILKQPFKASMLPTQVRFLFGQAKLEEDFQISYLDDSKVGKPGNIMLKLVPKKSGVNYKYMVFGIDPATLMVVETILYDVQEGSNHFIFSNLEMNSTPGIEERMFQFTPPPNVKVVEPSASSH